MGPLIRHFAISKDNKILAAAKFEKMVSIWDMISAERISNLETILDYGGERLALSHTGNPCITGSYRKGIAAYDIRSGSLLWHRKDLKKVQVISSSANSSYLYCEIDRSGCKIIDVLTGSNVEPFPDCDFVWESPFQPVQVWLKRKNLILRNETNIIATISLESFALLSLAFGRDRFCISESGMAMRCIDSSSGEEIWRYNSPTGSHILDIAYNADDDRFYGMEWPYENGGSHLLLSFASDSSDPELLGSFDSPFIYAFSDDGKYLIASDGKLRQTHDGSVVRTFGF